MFLLADMRETVVTTAAGSSPCPSRIRLARPHGRLRLAPVVSGRPVVYRPTETLFLPLPATLPTPTCGWVEKRSCASALGRPSLAILQTTSVRRTGANWMPQTPTWAAQDLC